MLKADGVAIGQGAVSAPVEPYGCDLANLPTHLIPRRLLDAFSRLPVDVPAQLAQHCWLDGDVSGSLTFRVPSAVHRDPWTLWVQEQGTRAVLPYLLDENAASFVARSQSGDAAEVKLTTRNRALLAAIGALARRSDVDAARW